MRKIKFRCWNKRKNKMQKCMDITWLNDPELLRINIGKNEIKCLEDEFVLMQFVGIKDNNGRDIYEGDICKRSYGRVRVIEYYKGCFGWWLWNTKKKNHKENEFVLLFGGNRFAREPEKFEVLGNIYENTELLKK